MGIFKFLKSDVITKVADVVDRFVTTKEEKERLNQEMIALLQDQELEIEKTLTERHRIDMASDSWLSKNIRPLTLIYLLGLLTTTIVLDSVKSANFDVSEGYIKLLEILSVIAFTFYFGGREVQKWVLNKKK